MRGRNLRQCLHRCQGCGVRGIRIKTDHLRMQPSPNSAKLNVAARKQRCDARPAPCLPSGHIRTRYAVATKAEQPWLGTLTAAEVAEEAATTQLSDAVDWAPT